MESVVAWAREAGHQVAPFGVDISEKLAELARQRLPRWRDRIFVGNALLWEPPARFDFVRTELVYVPPQRRREYAERLLARFVAPGGRLILCSYGSSRPEGARADPLVDEIRGWGLPLHCVHDVVSPEHGFVITRVVSVLCLGAAGASTGCRWTPARKGAGAMRILGLRSGGMHPRILHAGRWPSACTRRAAARFAGSHA
jgi:SAM-dependent methyltransferase